MYVYLIAYGGNTGDREACARGSLDFMRRFGSVGRQSRWKRTAPLRSERYETAGQEEYLNFVFEFVTALPPENLYQEICRIEDHFGHDRNAKWSPRAVDLDLLFFSPPHPHNASFQPESSLDFVSADGSLRIPHSEVWNRAFLLAMISGDLQIPLETLKNSQQTVLAGGNGEQ